MIPTILLITQIQHHSLSFDQGTPRQFVEALSADTNQPIVFAETHTADEEKLRTIKPEIRLSQLNFSSSQGIASIAHTLHQKLGDFNKTTSYLAFNSGTIDPNSFWPLAIRFYKPSDPTKLEIKNGFVYTKGVVSMLAGSLAQYSWGKELVFDPLYTNQVLDMSDYGGRSEVFLRTVATAIGADIIETPTKIEIVPNPHEFRLLLINTLQWIASKSPKVYKMFSLEYRAYAEVFGEITDSEMAKLLKHSSTKIVLKANRLGLEGQKLMKQYYMAGSGDLNPQSSGLLASFHPVWSTGYCTITRRVYPSFTYSNGKKGNKLVDITF